MKIRSTTRTPTLSLYNLRHGKPAPGTRLRSPVSTRVSSLQAPLALTHPYLVPRKRSPDYGKVIGLYSRVRCYEAPEIRSLKWNINGIQNLPHRHKNPSISKSFDETEERYQQEIGAWQTIDLAARQAVDEATSLLSPYDLAVCRFLANVRTQDMAKRFLGAEVKNSTEKQWQITAADFLSATPLGRHLQIMFGNYLKALRLPIALLERLNESLHTDPDKLSPIVIIRYGDLDYLTAGYDPKRVSYVQGHDACIIDAKVFGVEKRTNRNSGYFFSTGTPSFLQINNHGLSHIQDGIVAHTYYEIPPLVLASFFVAAFGEAYATDMELAMGGHGTEMFNQTLRHPSVKKYLKLDLFDGSEASIAYVKERQVEGYDVVFDLGATMSKAVARDGRYYTTEVAIDEEMEDHPFGPTMLFGKRKSGKVGTDSANVEMMLLDSLLLDPESYVIGLIEIFLDDDEDGARAAKTLETLAKFYASVPILSIESLRRYLSAVAETGQESIRAWLEETIAACEDRLQQVAALSKNITHTEAGHREDVSDTSTSMKSSLDGMDALLEILQSGNTPEFLSQPNKDEDWLAEAIISTLDWYVQLPDAERQSQSLVQHRIMTYIQDHLGLMAVIESKLSPVRCSQLLYLSLEERFATIRFLNKI